MCFTPQRRALFRHLDVKKWSGSGVFCTFLTWKCASRHNGVPFFDISTSKTQRRALFRHLNFQKWSGPGVLCTFWLGNVLRATTACTFSTSQLPKVVRTWGVLYILTWKCASCHNGVHFFNSSTSKSDGAGVFSTFWLGNVLRATTACTFSTAQLPKVVRTWGVLYILTWKCASRHNGVHFFDISTSKSGPNVRCFVHFDLEMLRATTACNFFSLIWPAGYAPAALARLLFDPPDPKSMEKHSELRLSYLFAHLHLLSSDFLHLLSSHFLTSPPWLFPPLLFHLCILSEVWLLNFLRLAMLCMI